MRDSLPPFRHSSSETRRTLSLVSLNEFAYPTASVSCTTAWPLLTAFATLLSLPLCSGDNFKSVVRLEKNGSAMMMFYFAGWKVLFSSALRIHRMSVMALNSANNVVPFASSMGIGKL